MTQSISVVINTLNEEKNITRAIKSVSWADEIVVCDMHSEDNTVEIAKKLGAKVILHKKVNYVEPARNFAISKAAGNWILILDPDEEISESLQNRLIQIANKMEQVNYVRIPRKNIIFNKWIKESSWWPDYQIRFFKNGQVKWTDKIHRSPEVKGLGIDLEEDEKWAIIHHNYQSISQFINRMDRYTSVEAEQKILEGYNFNWRDLLRIPLNEFLSRFFAKKGFEDGLHGLALSLLQAFSFLIVYLKVWELSKFKEYRFKLSEIEEEKKKAGYEIEYWIKQSGRLSPFRDFFKKLIH